MSDAEKNILLEHLGAQYKIFRDELRSYVGYAAASTTLLALLFFTEFTLARANNENPGDPRLYILIPISLVWYGAVLALFLSHISVKEKYCELIERKMNDLLVKGTFQFESGSYNFTKVKGDALQLTFFLIVIGMIPILFAGYAEYKALTEGFLVSSPFCVWTLIVISGVLFVGEFMVVYWIRQSRQKMNETLVNKWNNEIK